MSKKTIQRRLLDQVPIAWTVKNADGSAFGVEFMLCFTYKEVARIETKAGRDNWIVNSKFWNEIGKASVFPLITWGGIIRNHPEFDCDEGIDAIAEYLTGLDLDTVNRIVYALMRAWLAVINEEARPLFANALDKLERGEKLEPPKEENPADPQTAKIETSSEKSGQSADTILA
jgi:hypothetical protein